MDAKMKAYWRAITISLIGLALLIGVVENQLSPGRLCTTLELGIVGVGFGGIFVWVFHLSA